MNLFLSLSLSLLSLLYPFESSTAAATDSQNQQINIGKLQEDIKSHEHMLMESDEREISLVDELEQLDAKITKQKEKIAGLSQQIAEQEKMIAAKQEEIDRITLQKTALQEHLQQRLRSFYLMGKTGFLNVTFSSKTLPELLLLNDAFQKLVTYDRSVFDAYRESVAVIDRTKRSHELEKAVLEGFLHDTDTENRALASAAAEKNNLLKKVKTQKGLYAMALKEMKKAEKDLTSTLTGFKKVQEQKVRGFLLSKGRLPPPVSGEIISPFRAAGAENTDSTFSHGLTIKTHEKAEVRAVYAGQVIFSGYMRGYGKMIIIDHDLQYYTVTARFDELLVNEGDQVQQGQIVGLTGDIATLFGKGLYFEIRHDAVPEDPTEWLQPGSFSSSSTTRKAGS